MTKKQMYGIINRIRCPYCNYMMRILEETDDKYICYCASCKDDIWVKK